MFSQSPRKDAGCRGGLMCSVVLKVRVFNWPCYATAPLDATESYKLDLKMQYLSKGIYDFESYDDLKRSFFKCELRQPVLFCRRPIVLAYIVLCTFPCFAIIIVSSKVMPWRVIALVSVMHLLMFRSAMLQRGP